jgi:hypothetical protein
MESSYIKGFAGAGVSNKKVLDVRVTRTYLQNISVDSELLIWYYWRTNTKIFGSQRG